MGTCVLGTLSAVGHMLLPEHLVEAVVVEGERRHVADGIDVWVAGLQLAVHLHNTCN